MRLVAPLLFCVALLPVAVEARIYRWVDEHGNTQYTDSPPPVSARSVRELDRQGIVRATPAPRLTASQIAAERQAKLEAEAQRRRDRALLQSYTKPEEIDRTRDSQIEAVEARSQTSKLRLVAAQEKLKRLKGQISRWEQRKKPVPADLLADVKFVQDDIERIVKEQLQQEDEIRQIRLRAEDDKRRLRELLTGNPGAR